MELIHNPFVLYPTIFFYPLFFLDIPLIEFRFLLIQSDTPEFSLDDPFDLNIQVLH
ncbi:Uncharacterised protein [Streptococcus pneumoniae]|nr:Uncharacterised protein [Streptococcus pneumoniae]